MITSKSVPLFCVAFVLVSCVGCGGQSRLPISGNVSVDGQPVEDGYIEFRPLAGTASPTAGAPIEKGSYTVAAEKGILPGTFRVEIRAMRPGNKQVYDPATGEPQQGYEQFLPERFNQASELAVDIDGERTQYDFDLTVER